MEILKKLGRIALALFIFFIAGVIIYKTWINPSVKTFPAPQIQNVGPYEVTLLEYNKPVMTLCIKNTKKPLLIYADKGVGINNGWTIAEELTIEDKDSTIIQINESYQLFLFEIEPRGDKAKIKFSGRVIPENSFTPEYK